MPAGGPRGGPSGTGPTRQVASYGEFVALCAINVGVIVCGIMYYHGWARTLKKTQDTTLGEITGTSRRPQAENESSKKLKRSKSYAPQHKRYSLVCVLSCLCALL